MRIEKDGDKERWRMGMGRGIRIVNAQDQVGGENCNGDGGQKPEGLRKQNQAPLPPG